MFCQHNFKNIYIVLVLLIKLSNFFNVTALSEKECELWYRGLRYLYADTMKAPYPVQVQAWLRREFYAMENPRET